MSERLTMQPGSGAAVRPRSVLVVEDDESLSYGIRYALEKAVCTVWIAETAEAALAILGKEQIDLILLDVGLPDGSGFDLCRRIRQDGDTPIIFLTARDDETDVVRGLDAGGDDYVAKPFRIAELTARIEAVLRRSAKAGRETLKQFGDIRIDPQRCRVLKAGSPVHLTATEFRLLSLFRENHGQVIPRERLLELLWDSEARFVDSNTLSVYIRRLREKLEVRPNRPQHLLTVRGIGYRWR